MIDSDSSYNSSHNSNYEIDVFLSYLISGCMVKKSNFEFNRSVGI